MQRLDIVCRSGMPSGGSKLVRSITDVANFVIYDLNSFLKNKIDPCYVSTNYTTDYWQAAYKIKILYIKILTFLFKTMSSVSKELVLVLFLCSILSDSIDRLSFFPSSESPSSFPLSPESISALDPELAWSFLILTFVPNSFEGNPVWTNWDLEWPLLYW